VPPTVNILLVEADAGLSRPFSDALTQQGWKVVLGPDAVVALSAARMHHPAAAIVDERLPGGGGVRVIQRLRAALATAVTPIVALADAAASHADLLAAGAQECLTKPVTPEALVAAVARVLGHELTPATAPAHRLADQARLQALTETALLHAPPDRGLDLLTRVASELTGAPTALLSLVTADRQVFASETGLDEPWRSSRQTPMSHSFCQWSVASGEVFVVENAKTHPLVRHNPAVAELGVAAYAGIPVHASGDEIIGSFCVMDTKTRRWAPADLALLAGLASVVEVEIARRSGGTASPQALARSVVGGLRVLGAATQRVAQDDRDALLHLAATHVGALEAEALRNRR
jgi:DNA-binding response OmpR family regulator